MALHASGHASAHLNRIPACGRFRRQFLKGAFTQRQTFSAGSMFDGKKGRFKAGLNKNYRMLSQAHQAASQDGGVPALSVCFNAPKLEKLSMRSCRDSSSATYSRCFLMASSEGPCGSAALIAPSFCD